jgi:hypothetical protein
MTVGTTTTDVISSEASTLTSERSIECGISENDFVPNVPRFDGARNWETHKYVEQMSV